MTVSGSCHCGAVQFEAAYAPTDINDCQCSHCQKRGVLWAYYSPRDVSVTGSFSTYSWGVKRTRFHFCTVCGCTTHWTAADPKRDRMAINTRLLPPEAVAAAVVRQSPGPR
ncbi:aldehyde-activating protein [Devosia yakushimensis]|uniref:Aldehyde-activating protein n=1 Tax=Devosia yakushimensis TaxID=470028 RepID=A0ABQ5UD74_9HYPH|nr:aldehyde-activating protein [Devosia yakushimensis]